MEECVLGPLSFSETLQRTVECSVSSKSPLLFDASFCWPVDTADIATSLASRCDARSDRGAFDPFIFRVKKIILDRAPWRPRPRRRQTPVFCPR